MRNGSTQPPLQGPKTKMTHTLEYFVTHEENKPQLISLLFEQGKSDKYVHELRDRFLTLKFIQNGQFHRLCSREDGTYILANQIINPSHLCP